MKGRTKGWPRRPPQTRELCASLASCVCRARVKIEEQKKPMEGSILLFSLFINQERNLWWGRLFLLMKERERSPRKLGCSQRNRNEEREGLDQQRQVTHTHQTKHLLFTSPSSFSWLCVWERRKVGCECVCLLQMTMCDGCVWLRVPRDGILETLIEPKAKFLFFCTTLIEQRRKADSCATQEGHTNSLFSLMLL